MTLTRWRDLELGDDSDCFSCIMHQTMRYTIEVIFFICNALLYFNVYKFSSDILGNETGSFVLNISFIEICNNKETMSNKKKSLDCKFSKWSMKTKVAFNYYCYHISLFVGQQIYSEKAE